LVYSQIPVPDKNWLDILRQNIGAQENSILLESCQTFTSSQNTVEDEYSIYAFQPEILLDLNNQRVNCNNLVIPLNLQKNPFKALQYILDQFSKQPATELPFEGGLMGYLSYDLGLKSMNIPRNQADDFEIPDMITGFYPLALVMDHHKSMINIVGIEGREQQAQKLIQWVKKIAPRPLQPFHLQQHWQSNMSKKEYLQKFNQVKNYILSGDCYQVNLAQRWHATYEGDNWQAYNILAQENAAPFSAFMRFESCEVLSISPERFICCHGLQCESKPIKGTRPRNPDKSIDKKLSEELKDSVKDQAENVMIVDLLRNDLSKVCRPNSVTVPSLFAIESFPAVHHMVSTVCGELESNKSPLDLLEAAFPGGSITGAPKKRAMEIINELEPNRRNIYCGSLFYMGCNGKMDSNIAIRTLLCHQNNIYCWAGGGLVADSVDNEEYLETLTKVDKILPILEN